MDEWLIECAIRLGVTQRALETGYYMIDLHLVMFKLEQIEAQRQLGDLETFSFPYMSDERGREAFIERIREPLLRERDNGEQRLDTAGLARIREKLAGR